MSEQNQEDFTLEHWVNTAPEDFNLKKEFEEHIKPLMEQLEAKCLELGMPFFARFTLASLGATSEAMAMVNFGGPSRTTPEMLAHFHMSRLTGETPLEIMHLTRAAGERYSRLRENVSNH